jgi:hypothetical protein
MSIRAFYLVTLFLLPLASAQGQQERQDTSAVRRADSLRHRIEERFASRVQERLGLSNEQTAKLRATSQTFGARRRELHERERVLREALNQQLQPGVAARADSVARLTDALVELKLQAAQAARDEMKEVAGYLNPVQRARLFMMREQFSHRVKEAHGHGHRGMGRRHRHDRSWM